MRRRKGVVRNSNIFMDQLSKATKAFSEIQLYNVNKRYIKQVFQVPIDLRFLQVENIIRKAINRKEGVQQEPTLTDLIPLELSAYFIYNYIFLLVTNRLKHLNHYYQLYYRHLIQPYLIDH